MLLYQIIRPIAKLSFYAFYRKISLSNTDRIPTGKPVILAANHPTAFLEPCIMACFLDRPLYFLVRGDLFMQPLYDKLLRGINLLPVFRLKDAGYGNLKNNYSTFSTCYSALAENKTIMILAEGSTIQEKRLRPLQKGTARLALGTLSETDIDEVYVVPVGANFTYADKARSEVYIDFGHPIKASVFFDTYQENNNLGLASFTDHLREQLLPLIVTIDDKEDDQFVEQLHQILRTQHYLSSPPVHIKSYAPLQAELAVADTVNEMPPDEKAVLSEQTDIYFERLSQFGLDDRAVGGKDFAQSIVFLQLILGFPFQLLGRIWNYPPIYLGNYIARTKVKSLEFKAPVRWGVTLGSYILYLLLWLLTALISGKWSILLAAIGLLLAGYYALYYNELKERYQKSRRFKEIPSKQREKLKALRHSIINALEGHQVSV
jgi:glycerol-3-phosphate O-acyltransferase/dihydroxyacetone phosphate acyltransferase